MVRDHPPRTMDTEHKPDRVAKCRGVSAIAPVSLKDTARQRIRNASRTERKKKGRKTAGAPSSGIRCVAFETDVIKAKDLLQAVRMHQEAPQS
jgi:hypothetical protein